MPAVKNADQSSPAILWKGIFLHLTIKITFIQYNSSVPITLNHNWLISQTEVKNHASKDLRILAS